MCPGRRAAHDAGGFVEEFEEHAEVFQEGIGGFRGLDGGGGGDGDVDVSYEERLVCLAVRADHTGVTE